MVRIRHIAIATKDVERLVKFYTTVFGLKVVSGRGTGTYLSDGHVNLAILPLEPERKTEGYSHTEVPSNVGGATYSAPSLNAAA